jgi:hypothetical protein
MTMSPALRDIADQMSVSVAGEFASAFVPRDVTRDGRAPGAHRARPRKRAGEDTWRSRCRWHAPRLPEYREHRDRAGLIHEPSSSTPPAAVVSCSGSAPQSGHQRVPSPPLPLPCQVSVAGGKYVGALAAAR